MRTLISLVSFLVGLWRFIHLDEVRVRNGYIFLYITTTSTLDHDNGTYQHTKPNHNSHKAHSNERIKCVLIYSYKNKRKYTRVCRENLHHRVLGTRDSKAGSISTTTRLPRGTCLQDMIDRGSNIAHKAFTSITMHSYVQRVYLS